MSARPEALEFFEGDALEIIEAMRRGARIPGIAGHSDRLGMMRLMGLPLGTGNNGGTGGPKGGAAAAIREAGDRLAKALNRFNGTAFGRDPVIIDVHHDDNPYSHSDILGVTHKMDDLVREPDPTPKPPQPVTIAEPEPEPELPAFLR